jgi:hypothetical protein
MRDSRTASPSSSRTGTVIAWFAAGASVVASATAVAISAVALHRIAGRLGEQEPAAALVDYGRDRISAVGRAPSDSHVPVLRSVAAVPPENPHAPPTPPLGNPAIR